MTTLVMIAITLFGLIGYFQLPISNLPNVDFPTLQVTAGLPGASAETMASAVSIPLEKQFATISGLSEMTSSSTMGQSQITLQFENSRNMDGASLDVQAAITAASKSVSESAKMTRMEFVGPAVGAELAQSGFLAIVASLLCILAYIGFRFEWRMATGAVLSLAHDVLVTLGVFSWFQFEFDLTVLAAVLTVVGYSLNDTIVVFDRVRENARRLRKGDMREIIDISMTETLSRTLITSGTTLFTVGALLLFGGAALYGFAFTLFIGILVGTLSSITIASTVQELLGLSVEAYNQHEEETEEWETAP